MECFLLQIVGGRDTDAEFVGRSENVSVESDWVDIDGDLHQWTKGLRPVQVGRK